ncbi:hypothetical protein G6N05_02770 [Flavobacterium sp. F372]|uniref:ABC-2 type transporter domain-containing protein n=1 Tax=Flavobacterium bernardetii TaxID=2813823 RepID=A0ABR7IVP8_9FLAO|nr:hypothetical protein [Flavobacterium bernardetii]MBC5833798.1 hypothetical protein [Flavobacterium bernardetii]NHF69031.1 hypothetical protein [Flavobacterium bernardetii]
MFREFLVLIFDYLSISKKYLFFDMVIPLILSFFIIYVVPSQLAFNDEFIGQMISLVGILAGFNITAITFLSSTSSKMVDELKAKKGVERIGGKKINLFQELYIYISYSTLLAFIIIFFEVIGYVIPISSLYENWFFKLLCLLNLTTILHLVLLNIRNITFIYFSFFEKSN